MRQTTNYNMISDIIIIIFIILSIVALLEIFPALSFLKDSKFLCIISWVFSDRCPIGEINDSVIYNPCINIVLNVGGIKL